MAGQINRGSELGEYIYSLAKNTKYLNYVEIGTWNGQGSTQCFKDGFTERDDDWNFYSFESSLYFHELAVSNLGETDNRFNLIHGRVVDVSNVMTLDFAINNSDSGHRGSYHQWLDNDIKDYNSCENKIHILNNVDIDVLLLDGGEFSTIAEFEVLRDRVGIIILDDIIELKTKKINEILSLDSDWSVLFESQDRNGWSCHEKNN